MAQKSVERVFSRRSFLLFLFLAPAAILALIAIILATQYRQLQSVVSSRQAVAPFEWNAAGRARLDSLVDSLRAFSSGAGPDTLRLQASDLNLLAAASPTVKKQNIHFRIAATDSTLVVESTQSIEDQHRRLSWIFKKIIPREFQYLNARLEGVPQWKDGRLDFIPERGFLNGAKVPRAALLKRSGMSPRDFVDDAGLPAYHGVIRVLDTAFQAEGRLVLVRAPEARTSFR
jgi:hypothetical protein